MRCGADERLEQQALSASLHARMRLSVHVGLSTRSISHDDGRDVFTAMFVDHRLIVCWNHRFTLDNGSNNFLLPNHNAFHPARRSPFPLPRHSRWVKRYLRGCALR